MKGEIEKETEEETIEENEEDREEASFKKYESNSLWYFFILGSLTHQILSMNFLIS